MEPLSVAISVFAKAKHMWQTLDQAAPIAWPRSAVRGEG